MSEDRITVAMAGNPNSGKTTLFNSLTGSRQRVANWPGVTVEKKEGVCHRHGYHIKVVDLPGVYSLTAFSLDEIIARDYIIGERPDVVLNVVDASNLERNLYLSLQLLELRVKMVIALNMMDVAESKGYRIDLKGLSHLLGVPVVPMIASRKQGIDELLDMVISVHAGEIMANGINIQYGRDVEEEIYKLEKKISANSIVNGYPTRWLALKLLEDDKQIIERIRQS